MTCTIRRDAVADEDSTVGVNLTGMNVAETTAIVIMAVDTKIITRIVVGMRATPCKSVGVVIYEATVIMAVSGINLAGQYLEISIPTLAGALLLEAVGLEISIPTLAIGGLHLATAAEAEVVVVTATEAPADAATAEDDPLVAAVEVQAEAAEVMAVVVEAEDVVNMITVSEVVSFF